jgi:hypothetical protein
MTMFKHVRYVPERDVGELSDDIKIESETIQDDEIKGYIKFLKAINEIDEGFIYVARSTNNLNIYKIGKSAAPFKRVNQIRIYGHKFKIVLTRACTNKAKIEKLLHKELKQYSLGYELFKIEDPAIIDNALNKVKEQLKSGHLQCTNNINPQTTAT